MNLKKLNKIRSKKAYKIFWVLWMVGMIGYFGGKFILDDSEPANTEDPHKRYFGYTFIIALGIFCIIAIPVMILVKFKIQWHKDLDNPDYAIQKAMEKL